MAKEKCCFGVDVGGTTVKIGCFDKEGHLISKWEIPTRKESQGKYILPDVAESLKERMEMDGIELENVQGIGIGVPGPVLANGTVERCVNLGWGHTDMKGILRQYFPGVDIEAGNDANVAALGEVWRGAGRGKKNAVMVTLGTGVGGGVVIDGKIVSGVHGMGGEIGHIHIRDEDQDTCNCGGHGCLEQTASATGLVREAKRLLDAWSRRHRPPAWSGRQSGFCRRRRKRLLPCWSTGRSWKQRISLPARCREMSWPLRPSIP